MKTSKSGSNSAAVINAKDTPDAAIFKPAGQPSKMADLTHSARYKTLRNNR
ncbi:hypothetical protein HUU62_05050 [Rhodoferax sp. 4810]|nr:hypothetical protein [Rhodoferax jenense]